MSTAQLSARGHGHSRQGDRIGPPQGKVIAIYVSIERDWQPRIHSRTRRNDEGKIELATFSTDQRERLIGEDWRTLTLHLQPDMLAKARTAGLLQRVELTVTGVPTYVKVVVYDYATSGRARRL